MAPFKFPPPPPPPPPQSKPSNDALNTQGGQRGGPGRGRGGNAHGRGGYQNNHRGGHNQGHGRGGNRGGSNNRGGHRGAGQHHGGRGASHSQGAAHGSYQQQQPPHNAVQTFHTTSSAPQYPPNTPTNGAALFDPNALAQAMAFMATPAGMQSMTAFASHMAGGSVPQPNGQPFPSQQPIPQNQPFSPDSSRKRKRHERGVQYQQNPPPHHTSARAQKGLDTKLSTQKPPRAKAKAAPSIPGFGFSLPSVPKPPVAPKATGRVGQAKGQTKLGLTHNGQESSSEEDDEDEEDALAAKWNGNGITFEHNDEIISLQTGAEVAAYIKDRKRLYPTQKRIEQKAREEAERRTKELDFLRRVKGRQRRETDDEEQDLSNRRQKEDVKEQPAAPKPSLDELREKVKQSMQSKQDAIEHPKQNPIALGLGYDTDTDDDDDSSVLSESSVVSSSEPSDDSSDSDADSDAPPETQSTKVAVAPIVPPPAPKRPAQQATDPTEPSTKVCQQWKRTGKCKYKYCQDRHFIEEPKHVGLYERMVEQELEKRDRLALEAIKYLGRNGFLG